MNNQVENSLREQELKTQQKNTELEKANQELDRFIYSASHDLRAPLKSIQGLIGLSEHTNNLAEIKQSDEGKNIKVKTSIPENLMLNTDPICFAIVVNNLISNAFKYSDHQKESQFVKIEANRVNGNVQLKVKDNGEGISEQQMEKIFTMFYRASSKSNGSGLGLYLEAISKILSRASVIPSRSIGIIRIPR